MNGINRAQVLGRLTHDPELHYTKDGIAYCRLRVATNQWAKGKEHTDFHDAVAWGVLAEQSAKALKKGEAVYVEGRLQTDAWEQDGRKQQRTRIVALRVVFLGTGPRRADSEPVAQAVGEEPA